MRSAVTVGDYIIASGNGVFTPMQVLKLAYISHGYTLAIRDGEPLFHDRIEAWKYGPVIPNLYHALKEFGDKPIPRLYVCGTPVTSSLIKNRISELAEMLEAENCSIIDRVIEGYGDCDGFQLSDITHSEGSPWDTCYVKGQWHTEIPNDEIQRYYEDKINAVQ